MSKPNDIVDLRNQLCEIFDKVKSDSKFVPMAHESVNAAGKIIGTIAVQLKYCDILKVQPRIEFLESSHK